jgi:hypothetical protein
VNAGSHHGSIEASASMPASDRALSQNPAMHENPDGQTPLSH